MDFPLVVSTEAQDLIRLANSDTDSPKLYILLTDTGTTFSKVSKFFTKHPYNHVSLVFDANLEHIYTYSLTTPENGLRGGLKRETKELLKGARYSLYEMKVTRSIYRKVVERVNDLESRIEETSYNHRGIINALFNMEVFKNSGVDIAICTQFITSTLALAGVELFKGSDKLKPYELVKSKLLHHVKRGTF